MHCSASFHLLLLAWISLISALTIVMGYKEIVPQRSSPRTFLRNKRGVIKTTSSCDYFGKIVQPNTVILKEEDKTNQWSFITICNERAEIVHSEKLNCKPSSPTTASASATILKAFRKSWSVSAKATPKPQSPGCSYFGKNFPASSDILKVEDKVNNWSFTTSCNRYGEIYHSEKFNCLPTTASVMSAKSEPVRSARGISDSIPPELNGCIQNGKFYAPGEEISRGEDKKNNWCFGSVCGNGGNIIDWENFDCHPTTPSTTTPSP